MNKIESAKQTILMEIESSCADTHYPLKDKWGRKKIIEYFWACKSENYQDAKDWLISLYREKGMTEEEEQDLISGVELIMETIKRKDF